MGAVELNASAGSGGTGTSTGTYAPQYFNGIVGGAGGAGGDAAVSVTVAGSSLTAQSITLNVSAGDGGNAAIIEKKGKDNKGGDGGKAGIASVKGFILNGEMASVNINNNIVITGIGGKGGDGGSAYGSAGLAAVGGAAEAYGLTAADNGSYSVQFADLELKATGGAGGVGAGARRLHGDVNSSDGTLYKGTDGAAGGNATGKGLAVQGGVVQLTAANITSTATGGTGGGGKEGSDFADDSDDGEGAFKSTASGSGGESQALGIDIAQGTISGSVTGSITAVATGGTGGSGSKSGANSRKIGAEGIPGGSGGQATAVGIAVQNGLVEGLEIGRIEAQAIGGNGGNGTAGGLYGVVSGGTGGVGGSGGKALSYGLRSNSRAKITVANSISVNAIGGDGGQSGQGSKGTDGNSYHSSSDVVTNGVIGGQGGLSSSGGSAFAYGLYGSTEMSGSSIEVEATGGVGSKGETGGNGGTGGDVYPGGSANAGSGGTGGTGSNGGTGGDGYAYGVWGSGITAATVDSITAKATGGSGGDGGNAGNGGNGGRIYSSVGNDNGNGGNGGTGGNAYAYGVWGSEKAVLKLIVDNINAEALAGDGGTFGAKGTGGSAGTGGNGGTPGNEGADGEIGQKGAQAEAYGVYAEKGAVITLSTKTDGGAITIGAKAGNTATPEGSKAYAIYADNATVLFNDNAVLNSDGSSTDNDVLTYLNNATLGFGSPAEGQNVGRTINGGTLQLVGSNTFKVATDLSNIIPNADKFTFAKLAADSSTATQYITVGYDKAFDGSKLDSFVGDVTVLTVTNLDVDQNLNNFVGKESEMDDPLTRFLATPTVAVDGNDVKITKIDFKEVGASEAVMTAADAQMSIGNLWRIEGNNLMKRMGDLRSDPEAAKGGVWARYYRGEMSADSAYDRSFDQDYTAFQGGIDKVQDYKGGKLYTGIAVNRIDSNSGYNSGSGDLSSTGVGLYASWLGNKGHYLDVIARGSKLANDFKLVDKSGNTAKGDYDTWAYGISAEYGYRQDLQGGWFVEPQAELSLGRIGSADYTMSNDTQISQDAVNSAVTRLGVLSGKEFTMNGRQGNAYLKASLLHDFGGNGGGAAYYNGRSTVMESADMNGTWYEIGLGANLGLAKNSNLYFDALKTFGGDLRTEWQFNAGLRFTF
ncbi:autotransporter outer membrane beta-barrel domain-containing protein [Phascolarctobacterium sp.]